MTFATRFRFSVSVVAVSASCLCLVGNADAQAPVWQGYQGNPQHTGISNVASVAIEQVSWSTPVDLNPQYSGSALLIHYGSPMVTAANTVIVPVKTGATDGFKIQAFNGSSGQLLWEQATDYSRPASSWIPSYSPTLTPTNRLYYATAGGTISYRDGVNQTNATGSGQIAFFGDATYAANQAAYNANVKVNTPITSDAFGNIYFGYQVTDSSAVNGLQSGIARIGADGSRQFVAASTYDSAMTKLTLNNSPAISADGQTVYFTLNASGAGNNRLVAVNANNFTLINKVNMIDPGNGNSATNTDFGTSSVTIGPDGRVFIGVLRNPNTNSHGWMMQYNGALTQSLTPGAFGWDDTPSIIPKSMVDAMRAAGKYNGTSDYLLMTKYNDYYFPSSQTGTGLNRLAILDPNDTQVINGVTVMKEIETVLGPTHDPTPGFPPNAVYEWCINAAAVDPFTNSVLVNSEDGRMYRWDLLLNQLTQSVTLTNPTGEAYTPTVIGADGTVYAINNARLFALTPVPEPGTIVGVGGFLAFVALRRRMKRAS